MARKSRIAGTVETEAPAGKGIYKAGIYARQGFPMKPAERKRWRRRCIS